MQVHRQRAADLQGELAGSVAAAERLAREEAGRAIDLQGECDSLTESVRGLEAARERVEEEVLLLRANGGGPGGGGGGGGVGRGGVGARDDVSGEREGLAEARQACEALEARLATSELRRAVAEEEVAGLTRASAAMLAKMEDVSPPPCLSLSLSPSPSLPPSLSASLPLPHSLSLSLSPSLSYAGPRLSRWQQRRLPRAKCKSVGRRRQTLRAAPGSRLLWTKSKASPPRLTRSRQSCRNRWTRRSVMGESERRRLRHERRRGGRTPKSARRWLRRWRERVLDGQPPDPNSHDFS